MCDLNEVKGMKLNMKKYCKNCGKELKTSDEMCISCGHINKNIYNSQRINKIPGNGLSITGMILGIISSSWAAISLLSIAKIDTILNSPYLSNITIIKVPIAIGYTLFSLSPSLVGLPLSLVGLKKHKSSLNITGLILSTIALSIAIIEIVYIITI